MRTFLASLVMLMSVVSVSSAGASPEGQMSFALQVSLAPVWFDPAETTSTSVPFIVLYAVHDALVKAMPGQPMAPSLAESWTVSRDGLVYEFVLRKGVTFHNGEPVTGEDVSSRSSAIVERRRQRSRPASPRSRSKASGYASG